MMVTISGNKNTIAPGIANIPSAKAMPCEPNVEASHHSKPILDLASGFAACGAKCKRQQASNEPVDEPYGSLEIFGAVSDCTMR